MDDEGRPKRLWARLLFQPRQHTEREYRLGLVVVGVALLLAFFVFGPLIPRMIGDLIVAMIDGIAWVASLFSGGGAAEVATPVLTVEPSLVPSPLPSPSPSPSPLPR